MKRSKFTDYFYDETMAYEYKNRYFIMELCQQGELNPAHGSRQAPSDICNLSSVYDINAPIKDIGGGALKALGDFDSRAHPYSKFDLPARGKYISGLVGARGLSGLERESRQIIVKKEAKISKLFVFPTDNNNINNWIDLLPPIVLPIDSSDEKVGESLVEAFNRSTWHPNRKSV